MGVVEAATVSTRLNTLHDEAVHAGLLGELGLLDSRNGDPDRGPGIVQSINLRRPWAAKKSSRRPELAPRTAGPNWPRRSRRPNEVGRG